jgi:hypothetical protein
VSVPAAGEESSIASQLTGIVSATGTSRPVPTHNGSATRAAGARRPQLCVKASTMTTATRSIPNVTALSASSEGSRAISASSRPTWFSLSHSVLRTRYGSIVAIVR